MSTRQEIKFKKYLKVAMNISWNSIQTLEWVKSNQRNMEVHQFHPIWQLFEALLENPHGKKTFYRIFNEFESLTELKINHVSANFNS